MTPRSQGRADAERSGEPEKSPCVERDRAALDSADPVPGESGALRDLNLIVLAADSGETDPPAYLCAVFVV